MPITVFDEPGVAQETFDAMIAEIAYLRARYGYVGMEVYVTHELWYQFVQLTGAPAIWEYDQSKIHTESVWGLPLHTILAPRIEKQYRVVIVGDKL